MLPMVWNSSSLKASFHKSYRRCVTVTLWRRRFIRRFSHCLSVFRPIVGVAAKTTKIYVRMELLSRALCNLASCNPLNTYRCLRGICCFHLQWKTIKYIIDPTSLHPRRQLFFKNSCFLDGNQFLALQILYLLDSLYTHGIVSLTPGSLYPQRKRPPYPFHRSLDGPQTRCGRFWEEKPLARSRIRTVDSAARTLFAILTTR
jgi:hypothetical protein